MQSVLVVLLFSATFFLAPNAYSEERSGGGSGGTGYIGQTQSKRKVERFDVMGWIMENKKVVSEQNARWGGGRTGGVWFTPDLTLQYFTGSGDIARAGERMGALYETIYRGQLFLDNFISVGNDKRSINIDLGFEYYQSVAEKFKVDSAFTQTDYTYSEQGGALLLRPFGRSSQDTSLFVKAGYLDRTEKGHFTNSIREYHIIGTYLGAEAKLYLLPFLGAQAEYQAMLESTNDDLVGKVKISKLQYSGFLEIFLVQVKAYVATYENVFTPNSGAPSTKEVWSVVGLSGALHF